MQALFATTTFVAVHCPLTVQPSKRSCGCSVTKDCAFKGHDTPTKGDAKRERKRAGSILIINLIHREVDDTLNVNGAVQANCLKG